MKLEEAWLGAPPEFDHYDEEVETEVIVCGAGVAGVAAARAACEEGAKVVLFEKSTAPQGRSGQFAVIGGKLMEHWGIDNLPLANEIINRLMEENCYRVKQRIIRHVITHIGEDFDWYLDGLPEEGVFIANAATDIPPAGTKAHVLLMQHPHQPLYDRSQERFPCYSYTVQIRPNHLAVLRKNAELAQKTGNLTCYYSTPAKRLIRENGRVVGVIAQDYQGKVVCCRASKGVILATGDYSGDREMLATYCPWVLDNRIIPCGMAPDKKPINTGDGHKMGLWIGAKMEDGPHSSNAHNMGTSIGATPFLELDLNGERFMNEDCTGQKLENQISLLPQKTAWQFFDSAWPEQIPHMPVGHGTASLVLDEAAVARGESFDDLLPFDGYASQGFIDKTIAQGQTFTADTLEELVDQLGLPKEQALASLARYNQLAEQGNDEDFGKKASRMFPLVHPPFYASRITSAMLLCCHSGLESDHHCHCLDDQRNPIPGLYVAGNVQGNRFAVEYPTTLPGLSHSMALSMGREAGRQAAHCG
jgi:hypothetical protein